MDTVEEKAGAESLGLAKAFNTTSPAGRMMVQILGSNAPFGASALVAECWPPAKKALGLRRPKPTQRQQKENYPLGRFRSENGPRSREPVCFCADAPKKHEQWFHRCVEQTFST
jgi:hypothetical protein